MKNEAAASTAWLNRRPTFGRTLKALMKKLWLIKIRHVASVVEWVIACLVYIILYPVWYLAQIDYVGIEHPVSTPVTPNITNLAIFFLMHKQPRFAVMPNTQTAVTLIHDQIFNQIFTFIEMGMNVTLNINTEYFDDYEAMKEFLSLDDMNGLGIYWVNSEETDGFMNLRKPDLRIYTSSVFVDPKNDVLLLLQNSFAGILFQAANQTGITAIANPAGLIAGMEQTEQQYAAESSTMLMPVGIAYAFFLVLPIILSVMPDFQTLMEEKDSHIAAFSFLMGCSETAYWLSTFLMPFLLSLVPYIAMTAMLCYGFAYVGTDWSLLLVLSLFFIISHIWFVLFISTFLQKGTSGRSMTIILLVLTIFFSYLHQFFTLDENNTSTAAKHVFSIVPISCYEMIVMSIYTECMNARPSLTWSNLNADISYPMWIGLMWLIIDSIVYFLLFLIFNATNQRQFGTPIIKWREICNKSAWKRAFSKENIVQDVKVSSATDDFLKVNGLCKTYKGSKEVEALSDVDFEVKTGEVIVVIGPNGAGKSTLINVIAGAIEPTHGSMTLFGGDETTRFKEVQKYLGVVFQDNVIINLLSVREHLHLFGAFRGIPEDDLEESIRFFANTLQLTEMLDNRAGDLSGGQKRKLCIALSLLGDPPIILMDEPTAGVDVQARQLIWKTIANLSNTTSIITSHALEEAEAVSSRLFIVSQGKIPFKGTSTELRNQFKCGYLLRVDREDGTAGPVLELAQSFIAGAHLLEERPDTIAIPVDSAIPQFIGALDEKKDEYGIVSYSFSVEQLEDMLLKIIQEDEAQYQGNPTP